MNKLKVFRTFRIGAENATENGVKVSISRSRRKRMYCKVCRKYNMPVILVRTRDKPLHDLLQYSSVNELCPLCYSPMLPLFAKKGKRRRRVDVDSGRVDSRKLRKIERCDQCGGFIGSFSVWCKKCGKVHVTLNTTVPIF
jgi:Zn finger protein HypA/HybF involved in hydrogenase expression